MAFFPENLNFDLLNQNDPENDDDIKKKIDHYDEAGYGLVSFKIPVNPWSQRLLW